VINLDATIAWVLREQHRAIDELYSQLIPYGFMPTKSPTWPAMVLSWQLIQMLQLRGLIPDSSQDPDQSETPTAEQLRKEMHDTFDFAASVRCAPLSRRADREGRASHLRRDQLRRVVRPSRLSATETEYQDGYHRLSVRLAGVRRRTR
jgi:hypothetical protein